MLATRLTRHPQVGQRAALFPGMTKAIRNTALSVARAMLAGEPSEAGLAARIRTCLASPAPWCGGLVRRCAGMPRERWHRLTVRTLANLVERDDGFEQAWHGGDPPFVRHYLLNGPRHMNPAPLGLEGHAVPDWPHSGALAQWLGLSTGGLWRLTRCSAWQRRSPLAEQHYSFQLLAKRSGGWRLLEVPHPYLMALQRRLLDDLIDRVPPHEAAQGYTRERSVLDHARAHCGQAVVLKFDLQDFFSSVLASRVHALFATLGYPDQVARELTALCTVATPEPVLRRLHQHAGLSWPQVQRLRQAHLPQGAPTSAALANLCAFRLDLRLAGLARTLGARYTRYADDIVLSGDRHLGQARPRIEAWLARICMEEGFDLNLRKSRQQGNGRRQTVCNIVVNQRPNLPRDEFDRFKAILHRCVQHGPASQNRDGIERWREHLQGRLAWATQLNPGKAQRLRRLFDQIDWGDRGPAQTSSHSLRM